MIPKTTLLETSVSIECVGGHCPKLAKGLVDVIMANSEQKSGGDGGGVFFCLFFSDWTRAVNT